MQGSGFYYLFLIIYYIGYFSIIYYIGHDSIDPIELCWADCCPLPSITGLNLGLKLSPI